MTQVRSGQNNLENMQRIFLMIVLLSFALIGAACRKSETTENSPKPTPAATDAERGEKIVGEYLKRDAAPYRKSRVRMTISSEQEPAKIYVLEASRKQTGDETLTLTQIVEPKSEQDLASLTVEHKGAPTVNETYVSSTGQFRESGTNKMFFGGLTSQELLGEWGKYNSRLLSEKEKDGVKLFEVESTLKPEADSVIKRFVTLFRADDYLPAELHLYDNQDKELRTFIIKETRQIEGRAVVWRTEIENHVYKTKILIELLDMTFPQKIPDEIFQREYLKEIKN